MRTLVMISMAHAHTHIHTHRHADATEQVSGHSERVACAAQGCAISCREKIKNECVVRGQRQRVNVRQEAEES